MQYPNGFSSNAVYLPISMLNSQGTCAIFGNFEGRECVECGVFLPLSVFCQSNKSTGANLH